MQVLMCVSGLFDLRDSPVNSSPEWQYITANATQVIAISTELVIIDAPNIFPILAVVPGRWWIKLIIRHYNRISYRWMERVPSYHLTVPPRERISRNI